MKMKSGQIKLGSFANVPGEDVYSIEVGKVRGLEPRVHAGETLLVSSTTKVLEGDLVVVWSKKRVQGRQWVYARAFVGKQRGKLRLKSPKYKDEEREEVSDVFAMHKVIGTMWG